MQSRAREEAVRIQVRQPLPYSCGSVRGNPSQARSQSERNVHDLSTDPPPPPYNGSVAVDGPAISPANACDDLRQWNSLEPVERHPLRLADKES